MHLWSLLLDFRRCTLVSFDPMLSLQDDGFHISDIRCTCEYLSLWCFKILGSLFVTTAALAELIVYKRARALRLSSPSGTLLSWSGSSTYRLCRLGAILSLSFTSPHLFPPIPFPEPALPYRHTWFRPPLTFAQLNIWTGSAI